MVLLPCREFHVLQSVHSWRCPLRSLDHWPVGLLKHCIACTARQSGKGEERREGGLEHALHQLQSALAPLSVRTAPYVLLAAASCSHQAGCPLGPS